MPNLAYLAPGPSPSEPAPAAQRASGSGIVLAGDRSPEFRRARWHSAIVRVLRTCLPLASIAIVALFVRTVIETSGYGHPLVLPSVATTLDKEITMDNPRYEGFSKDGGTYTVTAKTAIPDLANPSLVKLNMITGEFYDARKSRTDLTATRGLFDNKASRLDLSDGIDVVTQTGIHAKLQSATMLTKDGILISQTPVEIDMPSGQITANQMSLNQKTHDATFLEAVKAHLVPQAKPAAAGSVASPPPPAVAAQPFGHANAPVNITADRLDIHDGAKTATFSGNVHATQSAAALESQALTITYEGGKDAGLTSSAPADTAQPAPKIKQIVSPGPVILTQNTGERVTGDAAEFDAAAETAVVTGNVIIIAGTDRRATAGRVEFHQKADTFLLTGNVVVTQARNELRGRHLTVDRKSGKTELVSPAEGALPRSRIFARLYQGDGKPGGPAKTATATAKAAVTEAAAAVTGGLTSFKTDPNAPVDIEADKLAADDTKKLAVFTGDVKAAQGEFIIRAAELVTSYSGEAGLANLSPATPGAAAPAKTPAQLTRIEARGRVIVTSKAGQEVTGDTAIFDTKANTVLVSGKEVILTQDKSVVRCNKLKIEMTTGQSNCLWEAAAGTTASAAQAAPGSPATANTAKQARPSVLFYPDERQKPGSTPKPPPAAKPASSSWEASTDPNPDPN